MSTPCIISVAITGSLPRKKDNPAVPITVAEQVESTQAAYEAGATLVHLHVRNDDETPPPRPSASRSAGRHPQALPGHDHAGLDRRPLGRGKERGGMLHLRPDMASLATGSVNFPTRVYDNAPDLVDWLAAEMKTHGIKPEVEAFDLSMIFQAVALQKDGQDRRPAARPVRDGHQERDAGRSRRLRVLRASTLARLAPDATWTGAGIGRDQLTLARWSLELGGHCRTGLEDNVRLDRDTLAPSNAALVKQVADLCDAYGRRPGHGRPKRAVCCACPPPRRTPRSPPEPLPLILCTPCRQSPPPTPSS